MDLEGFHRVRLGLVFPKASEGFLLGGILQAMQEFKVLTLQWVVLHLVSSHNRNLAMEAAHQIRI